MDKRYGMASALLLVAVMLVNCNRSGGVTRVVRPEGEILTVKGQYTLIVLSQDMMKEAFGPAWHGLTLFYGSNRAVTQDGERSMVSSTTLRPLAKGVPILVISGDDWPDLVVPIYAFEQRKQVVLLIDTVNGSIKLMPGTTQRVGEPALTSEGRLFFR